ncbi:MAG: carbohydrate-binding protein [Bacteroidota bacterium]
MKYRKQFLTRYGVLSCIMLVVCSCERDLSDEVVPATFPATAEIFTDAPVGVTDEFFESFDPALGANTEGFGTDDNVAFEGSTSIRIDVPAPNDPDGGFIGGIFRDRGEGRNLTGYDALTFWAKGSTTATIGTVGFGNDFGENKYLVTLNDIQLSTDWKKYIIPIPDASKLVQERGMFVFAAGSESTGGFGYTFWIDELRFENLGTLGQPRPKIMGGQDQTGQANVGTSIPLIGLSYTVNGSNGQDITVNAAPSYYDFKSSNTSVASVDELGIVTVVGRGEQDDNISVITGSIAGAQAQGSFTIESVNINVISLFSDVFANEPVDNFNGFYLEQNTEGGVVNEDGNNVISYTQLDFVAIEFYGRDSSGVPPIDASEMTHLHIDVRVDESVDPGDFVRFALFNNFTLPNSSEGSITISSNQLQANQWVEFDIPLENFSGLNGREALGALFTVTDNTISNLSLDNIYFYSEN